MCPDFLIKRQIPRKILTALKAGPKLMKTISFLIALLFGPYQPDTYFMRDVLSKEVIPFFCKKLKEHEDTIDPESPRDYMDYLILEARENEEIGYESIAITMWALYVGGGDTLATTMRWLCCVLAAYPDIQQKCFAELDKCYSENGKFVSEKCPYFNAVLLENFRFRPVGDSLLHKCIQDTEVGGYLIKKGTFVQVWVNLACFFYFKLMMTVSSMLRVETKITLTKGLLAICYVQLNQFSRT